MQRNSDSGEVKATCGVKIQSQDKEATTQAFQIMSLGVSIRMRYLSQLQGFLHKHTVMVSPTLNTLESCNYSVVTDSLLSLQCLDHQSDLLIPCWTQMANLKHKPIIRKPNMFCTGFDQLIAQGRFLCSILVRKALIKHRKRHLQ